MLNIIYTLSSSNTIKRSNPNIYKAITRSNPKAIIIYI